MTYIGLITRYITVAVVAFVIGVWTGRRSILNEDESWNS